MFKTFGLIAVICAAPLWGQVRKLQTRDMTRLSQVQIADYLKTSDIIFIPVGAVETNGIFPSDRDYVFPLAYAMTMAEETHSLFMPGLVWSFPGTTAAAQATIYISPSAGAAYLKEVAKSLLRQGFRRQVWVSAGQGPAPLTLGTVAHEVFEETHVPILFLNMDTFLPKLNLPRDARSKSLFGAHHIAGRLEDIPLKDDYGEKESHAAAPIPENTGYDTLFKLGYADPLSVGSWIADPMAHGIGFLPALPATAAEREEWGRLGRDQIIAIVKQMRLNDAMDALKRHDQFTNEILVPKFGSILIQP